MTGEIGRETAAGGWGVAGGDRPARWPLRGAGGFAPDSRGRGGRLGGTRDRQVRRGVPSEGMVRTGVTCPVRLGGSGAREGLRRSPGTCQSVCTVRSSRRARGLLGAKGGCQPRAALACPALTPDLAGWHLGMVAPLRSSIWVLCWEEPEEVIQVCPIPELGGGGKQGEVEGWGGEDTASAYPSLGLGSA